MSLLRNLAGLTRNAGHIIAKAGPYGMYLVVQIGLRRRRMRRVRELIERENELHRESKRMLNAELNRSIAAYQATSVEAASYWLALGLTSEVQR